MSIRQLHKLFLYYTAALIVALSASILYADEAEDAYQRGSKILAQGGFDKAIAEFNQAIKLKPEEAKYYGIRGSACFAKAITNRAWPI